MKCPLWHVRRKNKCECGVSFHCIVTCQSGADSITVGLTRCMTWDKKTDRAVIHHCPLSYNESCPHYLHVASVTIPTNVSGVELNAFTCNKYNRKGTLCKECKGGYGLRRFQMVLLVPTVANTNIFGSYTSFLNWLWSPFCIWLLFCFRSKGHQVHSMSSSHTVSCAFVPFSL